MPPKAQRKSGGMRKYGRNKARCERYAAFHTREKNKVRRVLRSSGVAEAEKYAAGKNVTGYLGSMMAYKIRKENQK